MAAHDRAERVLGFADELIAGLPVPISHQELLLVHLTEGRAQARDTPDLHAVHLPLLVHSAITGEEEPAVPLAAACTFVYLGADLFDNLADGEVPDCWAGRDAAQANLAAATYLAALPQLCLTELEQRGHPAQRVHAIARAFAETLLTMSSGQHEDLLFSHSAVVTPAASRAMVERKSGSEISLFARAGAMLATDDSDVIEAYAAFGACVGAAGQISSDLGDIWLADASQDLATGKRTLPIAHALGALRGAERARFLELLAQAGTSSAAREEVTATLGRAGSVRYTALVIEVYRQQALRHLTAASVRDPQRAELQALADGLSLLPARQVEPAPG